MEEYIREAPRVVTVPNEPLVSIFSIIFHTKNLVILQAFERIAIWIYSHIWNLLMKATWLSLLFFLHVCALELMCESNLSV